MGMFGDLDIASAKDNPYAIDDGTYTCFVVDVNVGPTKAGDKTGMKLFYRIDEGKYEGRKLQEWKEIPAKELLVSSDPDVREKSTRSLEYLKDRLRSLGIPVERMNNLEPDDIVGRKCMVSVITDKNGFVKVTRVAVVSNTPSVEPGGIKQFS